MTLLIIAACSVVHSIFGVGLLVFGTPIFMLLGHSYADTLWIVLPPSLAINAIQIYEAKDQIEQPKSYFLWFGVTTAVTAYYALTHVSDLDIRRAVGMMLVISAILRFFPLTQKILSKVLKNDEKLFVGLIGSIHGLTNMGGGLLTLMMGTLHKSKEAFRVNVAFGYLIMAAIKIATLIYLAVPLNSNTQLPINMLVAVLTYFVIGNALHKRLSSLTFNHAITVLILSFGILLLA